MKKILKRGISILLVFGFLLSVLSFTISCKKEKYQSVDTRVVLKLDDYEVTYDEYRYLYLNYKKGFVNKDNIPDGDLDIKIKEKVEETLRKVYAIRDLAKKYKINVSKSEEKQLKKNFSAFINVTYKDRESFLSAVENDYLTEYLTYRYMFYDVLLYEKVFRHITDESSLIIRASDEEILEDIKKNFYAATQIFISFDNGKTKQENRKKIEEAYQKVLDGEDFTTLVDKYGEDEYVSKGKVRYDTVDGSVIPEFEKAALKLEVGEISEIVESSIGYHIIKRMPLEDKEIDKQFEDLRDLYFTREFNYIVKDTGTELKMKPTKIFEEISLATMK